jgi:hypothetical protein
MFVTDYIPSEKRQLKADGGVERRITEAAVMLAFALHILEEAGDTATVRIHPDGEHAKIFEIVPFLNRRGFVRVEPMGKTAYGGRYVRDGHTIIVRPFPTEGDVWAEVGGVRIIAECKGAVINSTHSGTRSRTRKGFSELIGQLMVLPDDGARQVAVLPETADTAKLAPRLAARCAAAGIEIALVQPDGAIRYVLPEQTVAD